MTTTRMLVYWAWRLTHPLTGLTKETAWKIGFWGDYIAWRIRHPFGYFFSSYRMWWIIKKGIVKGNMSRFLNQTRERLFKRRMP